MSFVFDELVKDIDLNTKQTLTEYTLKHSFNLTNFVELDLKKEYLIRDIELILSSNNVSNINELIDVLKTNDNYYFTIKPSTRIGIAYNSIQLFTLPFYYKVYKDRVEFVDFFNIDNEFSDNIQTTNLYEYFGYTINNDEIIIRIPVTGYVLLDSKHFIDIKQHVLSNNSHLYKLLTYSNFDHLDILHIVLEYKLGTEYKFRYATNYYLRNLLDESINYTFYSQLSITPLNASVYMQKKYIPVKYKYTDNVQKYTYALIDYLTNIKNITNYESLHVMDLLIFSYLPITYTDQIFLLLLCKPKIVKNIKVYNTDIVYKVNNNIFSEIRQDNANNTVQIVFKDKVQARLFDIYSLIL